MRPESSMPRPNPQKRSGPRPASGNRARAVIGFFAVVFFVILISVREFANTITDYWWFDSVGYTNVWRTVLGVKVLLAIIFMALFFALCWVNLWLADRLGPPAREPSPEEEAVARFREVIGSRWGWLRIGVSAFFALSIGAGAAAQWRNWLLFNNSVSFGETDPHFGRDLSFFVFRLPFLNWLVGWMFTSLLVIVVLAIAMHYLSGGIRVQSVTERVTPQVKAHISLLLGAMALFRAAGYWLERFGLAYSSDGKFAGLSYTDVNARVPVLNLLILIALLSVVLFLVNIRRRGWGLPTVAVGLWALVAIGMGGIYPAMMQRLSVDPDETTKEAPYVARNIAATKQGFGLDVISQQRFAYQEDLTGADLQGNADNLSTLPLLDPQITDDTFTLQQKERAFFQFNEQDAVDVDRYEIDGEVVPVVIGARELNRGGIPESGWESEVLSFTHGNGLALAPSNTVKDSLPIFLIGDVPIDNQIADDLPIEQPRIYYGERMSGYSITNTDRAEIDSIEEGTRLTSSYEGSGGVEAGGLFRRSLFALRFQNLDTLISNFVRSDSRFLWNRDVRTRVNKVAPFLEFDSDPYPVVLDGRIVYVIDGYTTTTNFPYSQPRSRASMERGSDLWSANYNYVRNSVKGVVDAYNGSVDLYIVDSTDPLVAAYSKAFPGVLQGFDKMPPALIDNLRYPADIFLAQTNMWSRYHVDVDETDDLLEGSDEWSIAQDPGGVQGAGIESTIDEQGQLSQSEFRVDPYYSLMRLPGENEQEFTIVRTFVPFSDDDSVKELQGLMVGVSEPGTERYGRLVSYEIDNVTGAVEAPAPALVASQITSQKAISEEISLLNAKDEGSSVQFGDMVVLPVEDSFVYVRPMYVIATGTKQPNLEWIIVSHADRVVMCHGLTESIDALFGVAVTGVQSAGENECVGDVMTASRRPAPVTTPSTDPIEVTDGDALNQAADLLNQAREALMAGDLGRYQQLVDTATILLDEAVSAAN